MSTMTTTKTSTATTAVASMSVAITIRLKKIFFSACTTLVTFDDIAGQPSMPGIIPNGYKNLNWTNIAYINASSMPFKSGYRVAVSSPPFVAYNPSGGNVTITTANGTRFSFDSLFLTSAWRDSLNITMKTIRANSTTSIGVYTVMTTMGVTVYCNFCTDIDTMTLSAEGGTPNPDYIQNGTQFIIDNLCISFGH
jgi:hypothetical protein